MEGLEALPLTLFDGLARILRMVEEGGVWPEGLLDAYAAMIPKSGGDAAPSGQRPLCVLPVVYRVWASARIMQLEPWFRSWVPATVFSAGGGRVDSDVHLFVADVVKSFDRGILDWVLSSLGLPALSFSFCCGAFWEACEASNFSVGCSAWSRH